MNPKVPTRPPAPAPAPLPNPSQFVRDPQWYLPTKLLQDPVMVKITVRDGDDGERVTFNIPRALICTKSAYFKGAFENEFVEASRREIELPDVAPWVFEVFLGWLYTGGVYHDGVSVDRGMTVRGVSKADSKKRKIGDVENSYRNGVENGPPARRAAPRIEWDSEARQDQEIQSQFTPPAVPSFSDLSNIFKHASKDQNPSDPDSRYFNPTNWPYQDLFKLYIFSDQYDTRDLRMHIMNLIQLKILQLWPRKYEAVSVDDTNFALSRLPSTSPLRRLLVQYWARGVQPRYARPSGVATGVLDDLPHDFLVDCFVAAKTHAAANTCKCTEKRHGGPPTSCGAGTHSYDDWYTFFEIGPCEYHEHPSRPSEEEDRCIEMWNRLRGEFCNPDADTAAG